MGRSGYVESDGEDQWATIRWRGAVESAIRGRRGQKFLCELLTALDAMPVKELIQEALVEDGEICALGALGQRRGLKMDDIDPEDYGSVASLFGQSEALIREIEWQNDDFFGCGEDEGVKRARFIYMREWVLSRIESDPVSESQVC